MTTPASNTKATVIPCLRYRDAPAAIDWLCNAFGFEKHAVYPNPDGTIAHAQLSFGNGMVMLGSVSAQESEWGKLMKQPDEIGGAETQSAYLVVSDADAFTLGRRLPARGSCSISRTKTMADGASPVAILKATSGTSGLTIRGEARPLGIFGHWRLEWCNAWWPCLNPRRPQHDVYSRTVALYARAAVLRRSGLL